MGNALVLGNRKDEKALPIQIEILTEYLLVDEALMVASGIWSDLYSFWRPMVIHVLDEWQRPELAPIFRTAFRLLWQTTKEQLPEIGALTFEQICMSMDELAYALGRLHAFGALMDLSLTTYARNVALFHMACGHLSSFLGLYNHALLPHQVISILEENPLFKEELETTLVQYFGLPKEEHAQIIDEFYMNSIQRFDE